jgi:ribosomal protein S18 acetylase RimI-like enzyme
VVEPDVTPTIREASEGDAGAIAELWTEAYVRLGVGGRTQPYTTADFRYSARRGEVFVVDRRDRIEAEGNETARAGHERIAGVVVLLAPGAAERVVADGDEAELARLAVASSARGMGIGRALTRFCEERARAAGCSAVALWSRPRQVEAHRLYESLGYRRVPRRDSVDETGHGRLVFRLALDG